jgi:hypothetical protein
MNKNSKELIRVEVSVKRKVERFLIGKKQSIGDFYTKAADEKLKRERLENKTTNE